MVQRVYVVLLRGINVGGTNKVLMKELKQMLEGLECQKVKTYIQTGNIVLEHEEIAKSDFATKLRENMCKIYGFTPRVLVLYPEEIKGIFEGNPFPDAQGNRLHCFFLEDEPIEPDLTILDKIKVQSEEYEVAANCFYFHAPEGLGRSKLARKIEKVLAVPATARNWRTVTKIWSMVQESTVKEEEKAK